MNNTTRLYANITVVATTKSSLTIYYSRTPLSTQVQDLTNVYLLPIICIIGVLFNFFNISVLVNKNLKGRMYQFLLIISITDFIKLFFSAFLALFRCGAICPYGYNFYSKIYEQYFYLYFGNCCTVYGTALSVVASLDRLLSFYPSISKRAEKVAPFEMKCIALLIFSLLINCPEYVLTRSIKELGKLATFTNDTVEYEIVYSVVTNDLGKVVAMKTAQYALNIIRKLVLLGLLLLINIFVGIKFKQHMTKKRHITSRPSKASVVATSSLVDERSAISTISTTNSNNKEVKDKVTKSEQSVTKMILIMCVSCFFGNILDSFTAILFNILDTTSYNYHLLFSNCTLFIVHGLQFWLLYFFNAGFRNTFKKMYCCCTTSSKLNQTALLSISGHKSLAY